MKTLKSGILFVALALAVLQSCKYDDQFETAPAVASHATLTAAPGKHWRDRGPLVHSINRQPTSFWRSREEYRLTPGVKVMQVIADREPYDFSPVRFTAAAGRSYHLVYDKDRSHVLLYDTTGCQTKLIARSPREHAEEVVPSKPQRISDRYSHANVASYRVFESKVPGHQLALFTMKDGTRIPMLCKAENDCIYPLPQSVFTEGEGWNIMVEPEIVRGRTHSHTLMSLTVRTSGEDVLVGETKPRPVTPLPQLIRAQ